MLYLLPKFVIIFCSRVPITPSTFKFFVIDDMDFKETKSFSIGKTIGIIYLPITLFTFLAAIGVIKIWGTGASAFAFLFALFSLLAFIVSPILLVVSLVLLIKDCKTYENLDCYDMNIWDWICYAMVYAFPLIILFMLPHNN